MTQPSSDPCELTAWHGAPHPPRRWQREALDAILASLGRGERPVVEACTGSGKSYLIAEICRLGVVTGRPGHIVVATPTQHLVRQLAATLRQRCGDEVVGEYYAERRQPDRPVVVACYPSMARLTGEIGRVRLLIMDECHRSAAESVQAAIQTMHPHAILGVSATPYRSDEFEGLPIYSGVAYQYPIELAIRERVLVPYRVVTWDGDGADDLDRVCVEMMRPYATTLGRGVVSAASIDDAVTYARRLTDEGIRARAIYGTQSADVRDDILTDLRMRRIDCVVHVQLLVEGIDLPWLRWLCLRRRVGRVRLVQEVGRVLRVARGEYDEKPEAVILDPHLCMYHTGLLHPAALGESRPRTIADVAQRVAAILRAASHPMTVDDLAERARDSRVPQALERLTRDGSVAELPAGWVWDPWDLPDLPPMLRGVGRARALPALAAWVRQWAEHLGVAPPRGVDTGPPREPEIRQAQRYAHVTRVIPQPMRDVTKTMLRREVLASLDIDAAQCLAAVLGAVAGASRSTRRAHRYWRMPQGWYPPSPTPWEGP